ncbi:MAG: hypothetical protein C1O27_002670 [Chloroflexi bacterium]|nr:MAG: hypothetical protein C1O27_002670 [Chloroflexota bacterium]
MAVVGGGQYLLVGPEGVPSQQPEQESYDGMLLAGGQQHIAYGGFMVTA